MEHQPGMLESFHQFVGEQLSLGVADDMTPEQALSLFREREAALAAVRQGLADVAAGRTYAVDEVIDELRAKHR